MDLIKKIEKVISKSNLDSPKIELSYDDQNNVFGYITSDTFIDLTDQTAQDLLWDILRNGLFKDELLQIFMIFHETQQERSMRVLEENVIFSERQKDKMFPPEIWCYPLMDSRFIMFVDVVKKDTSYKSFYLIINGKRSYHHCLIKNYSKELIEFMQLEQEEIIQEILDSTYMNGQEEIVSTLIKEDEQLIKSGFKSRNKVFSNNYWDFRMNKCRKSELLLGKEEANYLKKYVNELKDFKIYKFLNEMIKASNLISEKNL